MTTENNGNIGEFLKPTSSSNEDLSEYTDADESISAPTEFLAEFLSAVMLKDYITALKYCKLILQYEPNNATAKEFYPLILQKLKQDMPNGNGGEGSSNDSEDEDSEGNTPSSSESDSSGTEESSEGQEEAEEEEEIEPVAGGKASKGSSEGDGTTGSYSSLEDDEAETDQLMALAAKYQIDNVNLGNGNKICSATHSNLYSKDRTYQLDNRFVTTRQPQNMASSDSESPTDPCQTTVAMLRARVVPNNV
ncbi:histone-lysine N-methyltransferase SETD1B isoform X2 [Anthonomus grandis grandis]|uniref:histone-lysine N-methyltransferase SETD1B isoform X1 n=1 Tax=Anthonomus grandis grandis TaxID=2921223 RepID=UPI0021658108|nr:histone-lysine N-methyltransferase SETD1B isoform X1 [Anthonomus grandis grandis]XP_050296747.1 histone-lysine N-methyltransferase SETD1B isoform X1 [Anthonomus grandis grandis]XP_050296748.1 histone-lysine N-methyltransferase SETD1B isoform X2 [Anthonomus grandis grandis]